VPTPGRLRLRGCAAGCGLLILIGLLFVGGFLWSAFRTNHQTLIQRQVLDTQYPDAERYTPPADGAIPEDRMRRFLAVRGELTGPCEKVAEHWQDMAVMNDLAGSETVSLRHLLGQGSRVVRGFPRLVKDYGRYVSERNRALLEQEMGLGEYSWIYAMSYFAGLGYRPTQAFPESDRPDIFHQRVIPQLRDMMARRLAEGPDRGLAPDSLSAWNTELDALAQDPGRVPFQDGLPPELAASIEPFRQELEALACPEASELDFATTERRGLWYDHR